MSNTNTIQDTPECTAISNHPYNAIYAKYIVCNRYGIRKHVAYDYIDAINYIYDYVPIQKGNIYRDNKDMYILGIPHICTSISMYKRIYTHEK